MNAKRDNRGRFLPGHGGGPGRPPRQREREYLAAFEQICTLDRWRRIVAQACADAEQGDARAREWLAKWLLPPPALKLIHSDEEEQDILDLTVASMTIEELRTIDEIARKAELIEASEIGQNGD